MGWRFDRELLVAPVTAKKEREARDNNAKGSDGKDSDRKSSQPKLVFKTVAGWGSPQQETRKRRRPDNRRGQNWRRTGEREQRRSRREEPRPARGEESRPTSHRRRRNSPPAGVIDLAREEPDPAPSPAPVPAPAPTTPAPAPAPTIPKTWKCEMCTYENPGTEVRCKLCNKLNTDVFMRIMRKEAMEVRSKRKRT
mmetsp:Transcript_5767/g.10442  ORF Transcript_5767/g.10442 Transcript_5767/m.10442 type:complete len:196 (-) Transcript_5767:340-927(-)